MIMTKNSLAESLLHQIIIIIIIIIENSFVMIVQNYQLSGEAWACAFEHQKFLFSGLRPIFSVLE